MYKFVLGLLLGLGAGAGFFHYQVKKVDGYSYKIGYMAGRVQGSGYADAEQACAIYTRYHYATAAPFGYTKSQADEFLQDLCQNQ